MQKRICHIAPLGMNSDWIKEGIIYYDWNYLIILVTAEQEYIDLANKLKQELTPGFRISDKRELENKLKKVIEIITIESRDAINYIHLIKNKLREIKKLGYQVYFNSTSGLQIWKFISYFLGATENLIDKFYYIPTDSNLDFSIRPLEIYLPIPLSAPLSNILQILNAQQISQKGLVEKTQFSKGLISRYIKNLRDFGLIYVSEKQKGKERFFEITEKGKWYL